jgi:hypothetical protein
VEKKACKSKAWTLKSSILPSNFKNMFHSVKSYDVILSKEMIWILFLRTKVKFKEKMMNFYYNENLYYIYSLHLVEFISLNCVLKAFKIPFS